MEAEQDKILREAEKAREVSKWASRYANNRAMSMTVFILIFILLFAALGFGVYCFANGWYVLGVFFAGVYLAGAWYFGVSWDKHEDHFIATTGVAQSECVLKVRKYLVGPLMFCVFVSVMLEQHGVFDAYLRVPVSAVYVCPMLFFANWKWGKGSFIGYLWGGLYGLWAIAILLGVPILTFREGGQFGPGDEIYLAVPVTGLIMGVVAYFL